MKILMVFVYLFLFTVVYSQNLNTHFEVFQVQKKLSKLNFRDIQYYGVLKELCYTSPQEAQRILEKVNESELGDEALFHYKEVWIINQLNLSNFDKALEYAIQMIPIVEKSNSNYKKSVIYIWLSECYILKFQFKEAQLYALKALSLNQNGKDQSLYLRSVIQLARIHYFEKNFAESMENCNKAMKVLELLTDNYEASRLYTVLGNIQKDIGNYDLALYYFNKAVALDEKMHNFVSLAKNLGFIAHLYYQQGDYYQSLEVNKKGIETAKLVNNKFSIANKFVLHGNCLLKIGKFDEAVQYYKEAEGFSKSIHYKSGYVWSNIGIIEYYLKIQSFQEAQKIIHLIQYHVDTLNQDDAYIAFYQDCANVYAGLGDYKKAYEYFQKFYDLAENNLKLSNKNQITQMGIIFQSELQKKENELIKQQNEMINNQNQLQKVIIFLIFFLLLISLVFIAYLYKQKKWLNVLNSELQRKNHEISLQQEELRAQNELVKKQKEELEAIDRYKSQLFAVITHDLKTPIVNLQMLLSILEKKTTAPRRYECLHTRSKK